MKLLTTKLITTLLLTVLYINTSGQINSFHIDNNISKDEAVELVDELSAKCWNLRESDSDSALLLGKYALEIASEYELDEKMPKLNGFIGVILLHYLYDVKGSLPYFQKSLAGSIETKDEVRLGYAYNNLGDVFILTGNFPLALQYSEKSIDIFKKIDNKMGIAYGYINMGIIYRNEKLYSLALEFFQNAVDLRKSIGDSVGYASGLLEIAKTNFDAGNIDASMEYYLNSFERHVEINNKRYTAFCLNGIGGIHYMRDEYDQALDNYLEAIRLNESRMSYYGLIENYTGIALVYAKQNEIQKGENALNNALEISKKLGLHPSLLKVYKSFSEFYSIINDDEKTAQNLSRFLVLYDSIYLVHQFQTLNELETNFKNRLSLDQTQQELISRKKELFYLVVIIILMVIIVSVFFWRLSAQRILNHKLIAANQTKDKLFSLISHDLRSPFNSIIGFSELLMENLSNSDNEKAKYYTNAIYSSSNDTLNLINNLLTWSRSQTGGIKFSPISTTIEPLFNDLERLYKHTLKKNNLKLIFKNSVYNEIKIDQTLLNIVLNNLISNAIKYTKAGGEIVVSASIKRKKLIIKVKDTGIGISNQLLEILFSEYSDNESNVGVRNEKGTGLGLIICKELIELHKGTIIAESKEGEGSSFTIEVPA